MTLKTGVVNKPAKLFAAGRSAIQLVVVSLMALPFLLGFGLHRLMQPLPASGERGSKRTGKIDGEWRGRSERSARATVAVDLFEAREGEAP